MIGKIRNIQDSWFMKAILVLTALSFMSLFGISGYIGSAAQNKTVIKVDDIIISQDAISQQLNRELQSARMLFGDNMEINENIRNALLQNIIQKELTRAILKKTAEDNNVKISNALILQMIANSPDFKDAQGNFNPEIMRRILTSVGMSEDMYVNNLKNDIIKQHLLLNPVQGINIPDFMAEYANRIDNQKKVFKYITINPRDMKIDRKISDDEKEQYYTDFAMQFIEPENRDVSFVALSVEDVANQFNPSEEEIAQYYNDNKAQFVTPEKRNVLQMVFESQDLANEALKKLNNGRNFYAVADSDAKQTKENTELGYVAKDELLPEVADSVFDLENNKFTQPIQSEFGWHIMKVSGITPTKVTSLEQATKQIVDTLRKEEAYNLADNLATEIEDLAGNGASLKDIAKQKNLKIWQVKALRENASAQSIPTQMEKIVKSADFVDTAFSYNVGETSQVFETENGFAVLTVDNVNEAFQKPIEAVEAEIVKLWTDNEKAAIAQEILNDVNNDLEDGDKIEDVAKRFNLPVKTTKALTRAETFAGLSPLQMQELFKETIDSPKYFQIGDVQVLAINTKVINSNIKPSRSDIISTKMRSSIIMSQNMAQQLVNEYGSDYDVRIKYKNVGLAD